jgi:hypothetical protein
MFNKEVSDSAMREVDFIILDLHKRAKCAPQVIHHVWTDMLFDLSHRREARV